MRRFREIVLSIFLACVAGATWAVSPALTLQQLDHKSWTTRDGAPAGMAAIAQTDDGYLWVGSTEGLFRFDGVSFEKYQPPYGQALLSGNIFSLRAAPGNGLWITYNLGGLTFLQNDKVVNYPASLTGSRGTVRSVAIAGDGTVWAASNGLTRLVDGKWRRVGKDMGFDASEAYNLMFDSGGTLWVNTEVDMYVLPAGADRFERTGARGSDESFAQAPDGGLWYTDAWGVRPLGVHLPFETEINSQKHDYLMESTKEVNQLMIDRDGSAWMLTRAEGILRLPSLREAALMSPTERAAVTQRFTHKDGLSSDYIHAALEDREGNVWAVGMHGLDRFRATALTPAPLPDSLMSFALAAGPQGSLFVGSSFQHLHQLSGQHEERVAQSPFDRIVALYRAPDDTLWAGGLGDLARIKDGVTTSVPIPDKFRQPPRDTQAMTLGGDGALWISIVGTPLMRVKDDAWLPAPPTPGTGPAVALLTDHAGRVWAGFMNGKLAVYQGEKVQLLTDKDGLTIGNVIALHESGDCLWIGGAAGLDAEVQGRIVEMRFGDLPVRGVSGIVTAVDGSLWLNSLTGVIRIARDELDRFRADPQRVVVYSKFDALDGLPGVPRQLRPIPTALEGSDHRLWFSTTDGVVSIDPAHIARNAVIPRTFIRTVRANGIGYEPDTLVKLAKGTRNIEIDYTATSLSIPERVRFKYRLAGLDADWQDAGGRRQAFYTQLEPGRYTFDVIAANNDGVWSATGSTVAIDIPPLFSQTIWFKLLCGFSILLLLWLAMLARMRRVVRMIRVRLLERVLERERIAREIHDTFLQSTQALSFRLYGAIAKLQGDPAAQAELEEALLQAESVMEEGRSLILELREPQSTTMGLQAALEAAGHELQELHSGNFEVTVQGRPRLLQPFVAEQLERIGREALMNAFRHGNAAMTRVKIQYGATAFRLAVSDDGVGIDPQVLAAGGKHGHFGLAGMHERARRIGARLQLGNQPKGGVEILVRISGSDAYVDSIWGPMVRGIRRFLAKAGAKTD